jgi:DNA (cytosine-5)-methyltransferase 1
VFVVGCIGNARAPAEVLFARESVQRDSAPRRAKGQAAPADASDGAGAGQWWDGSDCAATLTKKNAYGAQRMPDKDNLGAVLTPFRAGSIGGYTGERDTHAVAFSPGNLKRGAGAGPNEELFPTLNCSAGDQSPCVAIGTDMYNHAITGDVAATMGTPGSSVNASGTTVMQAYPINGMCLNKELRDKQMTGIGEDGDAMYTVRADGTQHAVGFNWQNAGGYGNANEGLGITVEGTGPLQRCQTPAVAFSCKDHGADAANVAPSLTASNDPSRSPQSAEVTQQVAAVHAATMTVRRLTPRECERLQAFPDDYTLIPWRKKSADQCPDGPRYKALGNSMAVNCMEWIGERIAAYKAKERKP